jgi:hypothetical protein
VVRPSEYQNTRIAALVSLVSYNTFQREADLHIRTEGGRSPDERWENAWSGHAGISQEPTLCCTVWENGTAKRRLPQDLCKSQRCKSYECNSWLDSSSLI